jgi:hypothetical protein
LPQLNEIGRDWWKRVGQDPLRHLHPKIFG